MTKKLTVLLTILFLTMTGTAACGGDGETEKPQSTQTNPQEYTNEQMLIEVQKMKDEGILDENGQPMPGVDLNDYPGLG